MNYKIRFIVVLIYISICHAMGCIRGDCYNGYGTIIYRNGEIYSGEFKKGLRDGYGIHIYGSSIVEKQNYK